MAAESIAANSGFGYKYQFVDTPSDMFVCKICRYPSREPHLSACCGHTFCKSCLEAAKRATAISDACPVCPDNEAFITIPNKQADRAIRSLHVFCTNKETGCEWQGEVNDIINHLGNSDGCQFEKVQCSYDCGKCLQRQYLTSHVEDECVRRKVDCPYCHITGEHQFIEGEHKEQCPKFPIACSNKCEVDNIPREDIDEHRKMCPLEKITCPNNCGISLQRQYITSHADTECSCRKVDCQYCHITGEHQFIEGKHKEQCPKIPIACPNKCEVGSFPRDDVDEHMKMCPLKLIQCEYHVVGCEERIARKDQKKHYKQEMEQHLAFTARKVSSTHHSLQALQTESQTLTNAQLHTMTIVKRLAQTEQAERDSTTKEELTSQLEEYKGSLTLKIEQVEKQCKEELAITKDDLTLKLQQTDNFLIANKQELTDIKNTFKTAQEGAKKTTDGFTEQLEKINDSHKEDINVVHSELTALRATQEKEKKRGDGLTKELEQARQDATSALKELTATKQNITVIQEEVNKLKKLLTASIEEGATSKDNLESIQLAAQKTKQDFIQQLATAQQKNELRRQFEDELKQELKTHQKNLKDVQEDNKVRQQKAEKFINELTQRLDKAERDLHITKQQLAKALESVKYTTKSYTHLTWPRSLEHRAISDQIVPVIVKMSNISQMLQESSPVAKMVMHIACGKSTVNHYSNAFYTHRNGYKMCLSVCLQGHSPYLSVHLYLMKGQYDDQLKWPMKGRCEVKLLNQINDSDHCIRMGERVWTPTPYPGIGDNAEMSTNFLMWSTNKFISYEDLSKVTATCCYHKNDSIFLEVNFKLEIVT